MMEPAWLHLYVSIYPRAVATGKSDSLEGGHLFCGFGTG